MIWLFVKAGLVVGGFRIEFVFCFRVEFLVSFIGWGFSLAFVVVIDYNFDEGFMMGI